MAAAWLGRRAGAARRIHIAVEVRRFVLGVTNQTGLFTTIREALGLR
ncbi:hypothetical protein [Streptomyces sp. NPDC001604]